MKLTKRQSDAVLRAAEIIANGEHFYSCSASILSLPKGGVWLSDTYAMFISPRKCRKVNMRDFEGKNWEVPDEVSRGHRVLALLMFREVFR